MSGDYSLPDVLERIYDNQLALEAAIMELSLWLEQSASPELGDNIRGALEAIGKTLATSSRAWPNSGLRISAKHQLSKTTSRSCQVIPLMCNMY